MKFTKCMLNIFLALTVLSVISFSESRRSTSKSRKTPEDAEVAKLTKYQAKLQIKKPDSLKEFDIQMDIESFDRMNYGIEFSMKTGAIIDSSFFLVSSNLYLFNLKFTQGINCLNQAMFSENTMHFLVHNHGINYEINFIFPNGWAFGAGKNLQSLCSKFYNRWVAHKSKTGAIKKEIMDLYGYYKLQEQKKAKNIDTRESLQTYNNEIIEEVRYTNSTINANQKDIDRVSQEINDIAIKQNKISEELDLVMIKIKNEQFNIKTHQDYIDAAKMNHGKVPTIQQSSIDNQWNQFKVSLQKLIDIHSEEDPLKATLKGYKINIKENAKNIIAILNKH